MFLIVFIFTICIKYNVVHNVTRQDKNVINMGPCIKDVNSSRRLSNKFKWTICKLDFSYYGLESK